MASTDTQRKKVFFNNFLLRIDTAGWRHPIARLLYSGTIYSSFFQQIMHHSKERFDSIIWNMLSYNYKELEKL